LTDEEILEYLEKIENLKMPDAESILESEKEEKWKDFFPYRERYLEFVCSIGENIDRYQTMLAELYIETMFKIQSKEYQDGILLPSLIMPRRQRLMKFLEDKQNYNSASLLEMISNSWMTEEKIILLVKMKRYDEAIKIFVDNGKFDEAEEFCNQRP